jgi:predicted ATPase
VTQQLPIRRVERSTYASLPTNAWPATIPAVAQLLRDGLSLGSATVLVGENGMGKSTVVEGIAMAYGLNAEGGSTHARHSTRTSESPLHTALHVVRGLGASKWGYFLRAETMHGLYTYLEENPSERRADSAFHELSHGESFLEVLRTRFDSPGLYVLDEPESALSFTSCLALVGLLHEIAETGTAQVLVATHSPVVAALPGARILELDAEGMHERQWAELDVVKHHREFLEQPMRYLRHVTAD